MIKRKDIEVEGKKIFVYDNMFSSQENIDIDYLINMSSFTRTNVDESAYNIKKTELKWLSELDQKSLLSHKVFSKYTKAIDVLQWDKTKIARQYINHASSESVDLIHTDCSSDQTDYYTILHYANFKWDNNWHGETLFYNDSSSEVLFASTIKPGRVIVFNSSIQHSATAPSIIAEYPRYTIVTKIISSIK